MISRKNLNDIFFTVLQGGDSEISYYIFVILSECDLYIDLSPKNKTFHILFKPKPMVKDNYGK